MVILRIAILAIVGYIGFVEFGSIPSNEINALGQFFVFVGALCLLILYFIPSYEAKQNKHTNLTAIALLNLFLGWTLIGWVAALVWAYSKK